jgi:hypothetical protein
MDFSLFHIDGSPDPKTVNKFKKYNQNKNWIAIKEGKYPDNLKEGLLLLKQAYDDGCKTLSLNKPTLIIITNDNYCNTHSSFGGYLPSFDKIYLVIKGRNVSDCCRTLYHELYHSYQNSKGLIKYDSGKDGDDIENEANSFAGKMMRKFNRNNPQVMFMSF